jgi:Fe-S oxidoreductase/nitrate reductase gamma subunit
MVVMHAIPEAVVDPAALFGGFYDWYKLSLDLSGLLIIVGVFLMMIRRGAFRLPKQDYRLPNGVAGGFDRRIYDLGDWFFLFYLLSMVLIGFLLEALGFVTGGPIPFWPWSPVGWATAVLLTEVGVHPETVASIQANLFLVHVIVNSGFLASIPFTKAIHVLLSPASIAMSSPGAAGRLDPVLVNAGTDEVGYRTISDLKRKHLLNLDACTRCGKCHEACPARASGLPLSPRDLILELREEAHSRLGLTKVGGISFVSMIGVLSTIAFAYMGFVAYTNPSPITAATFTPLIGILILAYLVFLAALLLNGKPSRPLVNEVIRSETLWGCMQCGACVQACPVNIEHVPIINQMRRSIVQLGELPPMLQTTLETIYRDGNSFGESNRKRGRWTAELEFPVKDAREEQTEYLWFVGDYASFDPRSQRVSRTLARILRSAGVDFAILYDGEKNSGNDVRRVGEEDLYEHLAKSNIGVMEACRFERVFTTDPHSFHTIKNEYPSLGKRFDVQHHTSLLLNLIETGKLKLTRRLNYRVTYHDPCHLGRLNGQYEPPRRLLAALGVELVEMPRNRANSFCCGAGGGRIWIPAPPGQEKPSENRIREAVALGGITYFVVACPKDVTMYEDAIKTSGHQAVIQLREITELVAEASGLLT